MCRAHKSCLKPNKIQTIGYISDNGYLIALIMLLIIIFKVLIESGTFILYFANIFDLNNLNNTNAQNSTLIQIMFLAVPITTLFPL